MNLDNEIHDIFKKQSIFLDSDDPLLAYARAVAKDQIKSMDEIKDLNIKLMEAKAKKLSEELSRNIEKFKDEFYRSMLKESEKTALAIFSQEKKLVGDIEKTIEDSLLKLKLAHRTYWFLSLALFLATMIVAFWLPSKANAATLGIKSASFAKQTSLGITGSTHFGSLMGISAEINQSVTEGDLNFGEARATLFPKSPLGFELSYGSASFDESTAESLSLGVTLKTSLFRIRPSIESKIVERGFSSENIRVGALDFELALSPRFSVDSRFSYGSDQEGTESAYKLGIGTAYRWSESVYSVHALDYICDDLCKSPVAPKLGLRYTPKKELNFTLSVQRFPITILAPIETQVTRKDDSTAVIQLKSALAI